MKLQINLSPCERYAAHARRIALAITVVAVTAGGLSGVAGNSAGRQAKEVLAGVPVAEVMPQAQPDVEWFGTNLDFGQGWGIQHALGELEVHLPSQVQVRRIQYNLAEGGLHVDVEASESDALSETVVALERHFARVRILERHDAGVAGGGRISMRMHLKEDVRP